MQAHAIVTEQFAASSPTPDEPVRDARPCYSMRLLQPFLQVLRQREDIAPLLSAFQSSQGEERIPIAKAHRLLEAAIELTRDPDLGLKASRLISFGDVGALDYLVCSSKTVGEALNVAARYMRLVDEALDVRVELDEARVWLRLESRVALPRAAADFQIGTLFLNYWRSWLGAHISGMTIVFRHAAPVNQREYQQTFAPAALRFSAPFNGFELDRRYLDFPLRSADWRLHQIIQAHAEQTLMNRPTPQSVTAEVRALVARELTAGNASAVRIAQRLGVSTRTLGRKLDREGVTFKELLDELRKQRALEYVGSHDFGLTEVALLLGFSQTAAFHRAFRRWTGQTPLQYRRLRMR
jgi:AraC-like DNA-binding protein